MEWFNELIGFLIVLFVLLVPLFRKFLVKKKEPKEIETIEEEVLIEEEPVPPPPPTPQPRPLPTTDGLVRRDFEFHAGIEDRELHSRIEERSLGTRVAPKFRERLVSERFLLVSTKMKSRKKSLLRILETKDPLQAMVILSEVFGPPKGGPPKSMQ